MSGVEHPLYVVALGALWAANRKSVAGAHSLPAFDSVAAARKFVARLSKQDGPPAAAYRIVKYEFTGDVREG